METARKEQDVPGTETHRYELAIVPFNLAAGEASPITVIENSEGFAQFDSIPPARAKDDGEIEGDRTGLIAQLIDQLAGRIPMLKFPGCF